MTESELIKVAPEPSESNIWQPRIGAETSGLMAKLGLDDINRHRVLGESVSIISNASPAAAGSHKTGLVIGYVQSGKTVSFTTVAALARDNGFRLVIICSGVNVNLYEQSRDRLRRDLRIDERRDRAWLFVDNPRPRAQMLQSIDGAIRDDPALPGLSRQTVLVTLMKNGTHLDNLIKILSKLKLDGVRTLVVDDEADQASLNNRVAAGLESATYRRIVELRSRLPNHTFLEYTATPQALLLINLIDVLSPDFAKVLGAGAGYVGGKAFFERRDLVRQIPEHEIPSSDNVLEEPPPTLVDALLLFFVGAAMGSMQGAIDNRSMMVHPSHRVESHGEYYRWVTGMQRLWLQLLEAGEGDSDYQDFLGRLAPVHADLRKTVPKLPGLNELLPYLKYALRVTQVHEVNRTKGPTPQPDWLQTYSHILVGGEVLNRGYTVEGLTVTYMPRSLGTHQADTIQQRARWFGYKEEYLGFCRVFLPDDAIRAYLNYVDHEQQLRRQIEAHLADGKSLKSWKRAFFLDPTLKPTRNSVIGAPLFRGNLGTGDWFSPDRPYLDPQAVEANRQLIGGLVRSLMREWNEWPGHPRRTDAQRHNVIRGLPLKDLYRDLLTAIRYAWMKDSMEFTGLLLQVSHYLELHPGALCTILHMDPLGAREVRSLDEDGKVLNLFQGANYDKSHQPPVETYPGDRAICDPPDLTVQLHHLPRINDKTGPNGKTVASDVWLAAIRVGTGMEAGWIVQAQPSFDDGLP
jgi:Z1 domain